MTGSPPRPRTFPAGSFHAVVHKPKIWLVATLLIALGLLHPNSAAARKAALLVGVSDYPFLPPKNSLKGPRYDVVLMRDQVLPRLGFEPADIVILADGVQGAAPPVRAAIVDAMEHLVTEAVSGDTIVIYFAGHGSIQIAKPEDVGTRSLDGFDAIFLSADARPGPLGRPDPHGVIVNYEIAGWVKRLRAKGTFVWLIADSCHSGYIDRDYKSGSQARDRFVSPEVLGIGRDALDTAARLAAAKLQTGSRELRLSVPDLVPVQAGADYVGFFAAQSTETTPEYPMPDEKSEIQGLFTYTLAQVVQSNPSASFAQFRDAILRRYAELQRPPSPMFVGTGLDKNVVGARPGVRQWPISRQDSRIVLGAGLLQGLGVGSLLAVLRDATAQDDAAIGFVTVTAARAFDSDVSPAERNGLPKIDPAATDKATARLVTAGIGMVLRVGVPTPATLADTSNQQVAKALSALRAQDGLLDKTSAHIDWVDAGAGGRDVVLVVNSGRVWFAGADGSYFARAAPGMPQTYSIPLSDDAAALTGAIWDTLQRVARTTNLARLAKEFASQPLEQLDVDISVRPAGQDHAERLLVGEIRTVRNGDKLIVTLGNRNTLPADVTVLYVDAAYHVSSLFPRNGQTPRLAPVTGGTTVQATFRTASTGRERLLVIAVQGRAAASAADFSFLEDQTADTSRGIHAGLEGLFARAGFPQFGSRNVAMDEEPSANWMNITSFDVAGKGQ